MKSRIRASFRVDTSQLEAALVEASRVLQGPPKPIRPASVGLFACEYCGGASNGLSCVHCGAPRRIVSAVSGRGVGLNANRAVAGMPPIDAIGFEV